MSALINKLLEGNYISPDNGEKISIPIKKIIIDDNAALEGCDFVRKNYAGKKISIVCDDNTFDALGKTVSENLSNAFKKINKIILDKKNQPDDIYINRVMYGVEESEVIIAVGSGTINDICKLVSYRQKKPYVVFGTAASMNGYASANASMIANGYRKSLPAQLPEAIFLDLHVLAEAPLSLVLSGLGDSICRTTSQADWLLSHHLLDTLYIRTPFELLKDAEKKLLKLSSSVAKKNKDAIKALAEMIILSGIGMYLSGGSYPASQGEHMIAHYMEMLHPKLCNHSMHGEQIGITTLSMSVLQWRVINQAKLKIKPSAYNIEYVINHFGPDIGSECVKEIAAKEINKGHAKKINSKLEKSWKEISSDIKKIMLPYENLHDTLEGSGAVMTPEQINWEKKLYLSAVANAHLTRSRFTFLDLLS